MRLRNKEAREEAFATLYALQELVGEALQAHHPETLEADIERLRLVLEPLTKLFVRAASLRDELLQARETT